jgi:hypothetical protein
MLETKVTLSYNFSVFSVRLSIFFPSKVGIDRSELKVSVRTLGGH